MEMFRVEERDMNFGNAIAVSIVNCPFGLIHLFGDIDPSFECYLEIQADSSSGPVIYRDICPVVLLSDAFDNSPEFSEVYQAILEKIQSSSRREIADREIKLFLLYSGYILGTLFSANEEEIPEVPKGLLQRLVGISRENSNAFCNETRKKLKHINPIWWRDFYKELRASKVRPQIQQLILFTARLFLEALEEEKGWMPQSLTQKSIHQSSNPIPIPAEKDPLRYMDWDNFFKDIEEFLSAQRKDP